MKHLFFLVFLTLIITSCGSSDNDAQNSVNESISDEKLENMFEEDKDKEKVGEVEPTPGEGRRKVKKQFLEIEKAPTFPSLEVNASYSDHYAQSIDVIMNKLWSSEDICQDCKYPMPSVVKARAFKISDWEKVLWHAVEKKLWIFRFKSSTFLSAKRYRSADGSQFILDLQTVDNDTAKKLEARTGLAYKATFKKLMYRFKLTKRDNGVDILFLGAGITGGLSSRVPHRILKKEFLVSLKNFYVAIR